MPDTTDQRVKRADFQATGDPALAAKGAGLLGYEELYLLWERQQWQVQAIDFTQDRVDWHERIPYGERFQRMYGLSSFFVGEQRVASELGPMMRAFPTEPMRLFCCTQIADEARHVAFFNRFYEQVGVLEASDLTGRLQETADHLNENFHALFDELLARRIDRLSREPGDLEALVEAVCIYHMVIEGMLALTGQHFIISRNEEAQTLPGFVEGFNNVARDEHRHVAFGARFLSEMAAEDRRYRSAIERTIAESAPCAEGVLTPPWYEPGTQLFGASIEETREFASKALERRLTAIGLSGVASRGA